MAYPQERKEAMASFTIWKSSLHFSIRHSRDVFFSSFS